MDTKVEVTVTSPKEKIPWAEKMHLYEVRKQYQAKYTQIQDWLAQCASWSESEYIQIWGPKEMLDTVPPPTPNQPNF